MHSRNCKKVYQFWFFLYCILTSFRNISCFEFDRNYFGVLFQPYVKQAENGSGFPSPRSYTFDNVETMLTLVSRKFSNVIVPGSFAFYDSYTPNFTYNYASYASVYSGEAAAVINMKSSSKIITILYSVNINRGYKRVEASILVVFEAIEKANKIFPGTVEGIGLLQPTSLPDFKIVLRFLHEHREKAIQLGLKIGAELNCFQLVDGNNGTLADVQRQIVKNSDFIICSSVMHDAKRGPAAAFEIISSNLISFRHYIHGINPKTETMGWTKWSSSGLSEHKTVDNLNLIWQTANNWAVNNKYRIFLRDAVDIPDNKNPDDDHLGWWKLTDNAKINVVDGYVQKVYESSKRVLSGNSSTSTNNDKVNKTPKSKDDFLSRPWNVTTVSLTAIGFIFVVVALAFGFILIYHKRKRNLPSMTDIKNFVFGNTNPGNRSEAGIDSAMNAAYDNALEISIDKLKIDNTIILGSGEFGFVFRALINWDEDRVDEVALKIAKDNCQPAAIKGLLSEIKIMSYLGKHSNIVELKGAYTAELNQGIVYVATELCSLGSLQGYLRGTSAAETINEMNRSETFYVNEAAQEIELTTMQNISKLDMLRWSYEIACGMEYLEKKHVVHADLATRNILLSSEKIAKITDFGLSRRMYNYINYVKKKPKPLPWRWMAIEALKRSEFSSKSDVWSYGITLWEIFSKGDIPYPGLSWTPSFVTRLLGGLRPDFPQFATPQIYDIMRECWSLESKERPSFAELVELTRNELEKGQANIHIKPLYANQAESFHSAARGNAEAQEELRSDHRDKYLLDAGFNGSK